MQVDASQLEAHRAPLTGHCYRMLGSAFDAEDAVQETMVRAWQSLDRFEGRSSLRTWLYRIATNVCLDALSDRSRRARPMEEGPHGSVEDHLETRERTHWLEADPRRPRPSADANPFELTALRQSIRLAFVSALQHLPPRQRAALLLSEVLGWSAAEVAECLEHVRRCREQRVAAGSRRRRCAQRNGRAQRAALGRANDVAGSISSMRFTATTSMRLVALLREDATLSMPPYTLWLRGPEHDSDLAARQRRGLPGFAAVADPRVRRSRLRPVPPVARRRSQPWALIVLELDGDAYRGLELFPRHREALPAVRPSAATSSRAEPLPS